MSELSEFLKSERLRQGLTIKAVSEKSKLSVNVIQALEDGDFARIGAPLLLRSFVSSYCTVLGVEVGPVLEKYAGEIKSRNWQDEGIQRYRTMTRSFKRTRQPRVFFILILGLSLVGALYGGVLISNRQEKLSESQPVKKEGYPQQELPSDLPAKQAPAKLPDEKAQPPATTRQSSPPQLKEKGAESRSATAEAPPVQPPPVPKPVAEAPPEASLPKPSVENTPRETEAVLPTTFSAGSEEQKHRLLFEATQETWVQVKPDNGKPQSVLLKPGDTREWEMAETAAILVGNAGGVQVKWDGKAVSLPGKSGSVVKIRLPDPRYLKE